MTTQEPKRIGIVGYDRVMALDIVGPADAFASAWIAGEREDDPGTRAYEVVLIGVRDKPFTSESGITFKPRYSLETAPVLDTMIIPGGGGLREGTTAFEVAAWIHQRAPKTRRIVSICTGIYGLALTGLLDGRRVATHWNHCRDLAHRFPLLKVDPVPLYIKDGPFYTSAGVTAGVDLALALIEEDCGRRVALEVARELVLYLKRPGGQEQFSEPLRFQIDASDRFGDVAAWVTSHLHANLSVENLAAKAAMCPRHFSRRFKQVFGQTPAVFVEEMRLAEIRRRLTTTGHAVEAIAASVGFGDSDTLRRAFRRRFGISPTDYRNRFKSSRTARDDSN